VKTIDFVRILRLGEYLLTGFSFVLQKMKKVYMYFK